MISIVRLHTDMWVGATRCFLIVSMEIFHSIFDILDVSRKLFNSSQLIAIGLNPVITLGGGDNVLKTRRPPVTTSIGLMFSKPSQFDESPSMITTSYLFVNFSGTLLKSSWEKLNERFENSFFGK